MLIKEIGQCLAHSPLYVINVISTKYRLKDYPNEIPPEFTNLPKAVPVYGVHGF